MIKYVFNEQVPMTAEMSEYNLNQPYAQRTMPYMPPMTPPTNLPTFPPATPTTPQVPPMTPPAPGTTQPPVFEESYIENILRLNKGKVATVYMTYENNTQWNAKVYKGVVETAGRDHIILSDPKTGTRYILLMVNLDYITFDEEINYSYPYTTNQVRR